MAESLEKPQIVIHLEKHLNYTVYDTKWIPCSAKFVVLGSHPRNTGALQVYELSKGELKLVSEVGVENGSRAMKQQVITAPGSHIRLMCCVSKCWCVGEVKYGSASCYQEEIK